MNSTNRFKQLRLDHAWSQEQLAQIAAVSVRTIQRIENGEQPSLETLSALAAVFEVDVAELAEHEVRQSGGSPDGAALDRRIREAHLRLAEERRFYRNLFTAILVCAVLYVINRFSSSATHWFIWPVLIWGALLAIRAARIFLLHDWLLRWQQNRLQNILRK
jgi:transcriptional regulator with XRE-family HTH domain